MGFSRWGGLYGLGKEVTTIPTKLLARRIRGLAAWTNFDQRLAAIAAELLVGWVFAATLRAVHRLLSWLVRRTSAAPDLLNSTKRRGRASSMRQRRKSFGQFRLQ